MLLSYSASADTIENIIEQTGVANIIREGNKIPSVELLQLIFMTRQKLVMGEC